MGRSVVVILGGGMTKKVATAVCEVDATEVAVKVMPKFAVTVAGALYITEVLVTLVRLPHTLPLHPGPERVQLTPLFPISLVKLAENAMACPWSMLGGVPGVMVTAISEAEDGWLLVQPHITTRIESTSASFFIIYAFPLP